MTSGVDAEHGRRRRRGERVGDVEAAAERRPRAARPRHVSSWWSAVTTRSAASASEYGTISIGAASSSSRPWASSALLTPDRRQLRREQPGLGAEVRLRRAVQVEVVGAEVREHRRPRTGCRRRGAGRGRATTPPSRRPGRPASRAAARRACSSGASGVVFVPDSVPITVVGRPAARRIAASRCARRRLAVGAGDADDGERPARVAGRRRTATGPIARRVSATTSWPTGRRRRRTWSTSSAVAPAATAPAA